MCVEVGGRNPDAILDDGRAELVDFGSIIICNHCSVVLKCYVSPTAWPAHPPHKLVTGRRVGRCLLVGQPIIISHNGEIGLSLSKCHVHCMSLVLGEHLYEHLFMPLHRRTCVDIIHVKPCDNPVRSWGLGGRLKLSNYRKRYYNSFCIRRVMLSLALFWRGQVLAEVVARVFQGEMHSAEFSSNRQGRLLDERLRLLRV